MLKVKLHAQKCTFLVSLSLFSLLKRGGVSNKVKKNEKLNPYPKT